MGRDGGLSWTFSYLKNENVLTVQVSFLKASLLQTVLMYKPESVCNTASTHPAVTHSQLRASLEASELTQTDAKNSAAKLHGYDYTGIVYLKMVCRCIS